MIGEAGFEPVVEIRGGELDAILSCGEQEVIEDGQGAAQVLEAAEESFGIAQGVGVDFHVGLGCWLVWLDECVGGVFPVKDGHVPSSYAEAVDVFQGEEWFSAAVPVAEAMLSPR